MPRSNTRVNTKIIRSPGLVDLHFHGAFGIDCLQATAAELDLLAEKLLAGGVAAFCPTTLSCEKELLREAVTRLGAWIRKRSAPSNSRRGGRPAAIPLGIHLEGPFLNPIARGAHPESAVRPFAWSELQALWEASQHTLKILTLAPELLSEPELRKLARWADDKKVLLSMGHSRANEAQARTAVAAGFRSVTHAWNAMAFHQREPGILGATLGHPDVYLELILDQIHVAPSVLRWTHAVHSPAHLCGVSDCTPAAELPPEQSASFGPLQVQVREGASRVIPKASQPGSAPETQAPLAGGGRLLPELFRAWLEALSNTHSNPSTFPTLMSAWLPCVTTAPLNALRLPSARKRAVLDRLTLQWHTSQPQALKRRSVKKQAQKPPKARQSPPSENQLTLTIHFR